MIHNIQHLILNKHILPKEEVKKLDKHLVYKKYKKRSFITEQGQTEEYLSFIIKGGTRIFYVKDGQEYNVNFKFENQFTGSFSSFFTQTPSRQYVQAIEDTELYRINFASLSEVYKISEDVEKFARLHAEMLFVEKELHEASLMIDSIDERFRHLTESKKEWVRRVPQYYLASYLNVTPETFSRLKRRNSLKVA